MAYAKLFLPSANQIARKWRMQSDEFRYKSYVCSLSTSKNKNKKDKKMAIF